MSKRIIGLDIGSSSIKIVELSRTLNAYRLENFLYKELTFEEGRSHNEVISSTLRSLVEENAIKEETVVSSIPPQTAVLRNITVPFRDIKKIRQIIKYEIESDIPFPIDDMIVDFIVTNRESPDKTEVLVVAVNKNVIRDHLELLNDCGLDPYKIDINSFALCNSFATLQYQDSGSYSAFDPKSLFHFWKKDQEHEGPGDSIALIDIGASNTSINILKDGILKFTRCVPKGGFYITEAIMKELNMAYTEAEELKRSEEIIDITRISDIVDSVLADIQKDIVRSFHSYDARYKEETVINEIILTGGVSKTKFIVDNFSRKFNIKTSLFDFCEDIPHSLLNISLSDIAPLFPVGMGLAFKGINKGNISVNLRKEEFLFKKSYHDIKGRLIFASASLIFIFILSVFDLYYHLSLKEGRFNSLSTQVRSIFMETFPEVKTIVNEVQQMKSKIKENNDKLQGFGGVVGAQLSSLELLRELSLRIPEEIKIDITEMMITQETIRINGRTDSFDSVDDIRKGLEGSTYFKEVKITDTKAKANENKVDFKASISLIGGV